MWHIHIRTFKTNNPNSNMYNNGTKKHSNKKQKINKKHKKKMYKNNVDI